MSKDENIRLLEGLYPENGESLEEFYSRNENEIAANVSDEEGEIISAYHLSGGADKNLLRLIFPSIKERKLENLSERGAFKIRIEKIASIYPLFGKDINVPWTLTLSDVVKAILSLIGIEELYLNERRMSTFFCSPSYHSIFPSLEREELDNLTHKIVSNLFELEILMKEGKRMKMDKKKAFDLMGLDDVRLSSYILFPTLDEWVRKKSFFFIHLIKKIRGIEESRIDEYINRAALISGFSFHNREDLFTLLLLQNHEGMIFSPSDESSEGPAMISNDYSISILGAVPPLISLLAEPVSMDRMKIFRLSKESILNAFRLSYNDKDIIGFLESISDYKLSPMLSERIAIWYGEYSRISFERALILRADEKSAKIIKNLPQMKEYILEDLGGGIFIMDSLSESEWRMVLRNASFDMLSMTKGPEFNYSSYEKEEYFIDSPTLIDLGKERSVPFDEEKRRSLSASLEEKDPLIKRIKEMMITSGIIFSPSQLEKKLEIEIADAFNYGEKHRLIEKAYKDKSLALAVENHNGRTAVGKVEMVESFEEGDHMILSHKVLSISRLYRVALVPASFL